MKTETIYLIILGSALVTVIPRILPFIFVRSIQMPEVVSKWLTFIPVCIFSALIVDSFITEGPHLINIDWHVLLAIIPTILIALWTKSLSITVAFGVICMALIRLLL